MSNNPTRVRTKRTNRRPALHLSTLNPQHYNVRPGEQRTIVCPDCRRWRKVTGETKLMIEDHAFFDLARGSSKDRCGGSFQHVVIDIDIRKWEAQQERLLCDAMPAENRRQARQFHKPAPPVGSPLDRIAQQRAEVQDHEDSDTHREQCDMCKSRAQLREEHAKFATGGTGQRARRKRDQWHDALPAAQAADIKRVPSDAVSTAKGPDVPVNHLSITR